MQTMMGLSSAANGGGAIPSPAGTKRKADASSLSDELRFAKRFNLLKIGTGHGEGIARVPWGGTNVDGAADAERGGNSNLYIPISQHASHTSNHDHDRNEKATHEDDSMQVDDTRDRVYIRDLDEELADDEPEEEKLIFLPDIDRYFSKLPQQLLQSRKEDDNEGKELVLYSIPRSLAVDEEHDNVRRAIIESRQRARAKAAEEARQMDMNCKYGQTAAVIPTETAHGYSAGYHDEHLEEEDPDAMDMD